jgi:hypothetical protein
MLSNTLNTNEVKDRSNAEVEFERMLTTGQTTQFKKITETVGLPYRLSIKHQTVGTGASETRQSVVIFEKTSENTAGDKVRTVAQIKLSIPVGVADDLNDAKDLLANLLSFVGTTDGATLLHNGTGNGAAALLNETL